MTKLLAAMALWFALAGSATACQYAWDAPTTNTDGTPLTDLASYTLYYRQFPSDPGLGIASVLAPTTTVTNPGGCQKGDYWVTASNKAGVESDPSNVVHIDKPKPPVLRTITK